MNRSDKWTLNVNFSKMPDYLHIRSGCNVFWEEYSAGSNLWWQNTVS